MAMQGGMAKAWQALGAFGLALALQALPSAAQEGVTIAHGISTFGELKYPADFPHLAYVNPDAPKGGTISQWAQGGFDSMNPYSVKGRGAALATVMHESILTGTADEIGAAYCLLCTTLEYPKDRSWVIFNLRPEARFSDGSPLTAEDVLFSYQTLLAKGLSDFRKVLAEQVAAVEVLDPHRVKFTFKPGFPTRDLPSDMGGLPIFSKAQYIADKLDLEESTLTPFVGSGPYMFDKMEVGRWVQYKRNPDYWGESLPINKGRSNFDVIRYEYFNDSNAAFEGFKAGVYTLRTENSSKAWAEQYNFPALDAGHVRKVELPNGAKAPGQGFIFNLRRPQLKDPRVREALGRVFNFEWSNNTLFYGLYKRIDSVWENSWLEAEGPPSPEEVALLEPLVQEGLLPAAILTDPPFSPANGSEGQLSRADLRAASALLDEAGWTVGSDGKRRNAEGTLLSLEILNDTQTFDRVINPYIENLIALGVDARMIKVDDAQMEARTRPPNMDFDMIISAARSGYISGSELLQYYGSETADISVFNPAGLKSPAVDRMIQNVMASQSLDELTVATKALDRVLRAERFWLPQWYNPSHWVAYYDMYEHPETLPPYALGVLDFWWANSEKEAALRAAGALK